MMLPHAEKVVADSNHRPTVHTHNQLKSALVVRESIHRGCVNAWLFPELRSGTLVAQDFTGTRPRSLLGENTQKRIIKLLPCVPDILLPHYRLTPDGCLSVHTLTAAAVRRDVCFQPKCFACGLLQGCF